jgi:hypothetical protein
MKAKRFFVMGMLAAALFAAACDNPAGSTPEGPGNPDERPVLGVTSVTVSPSTPGVVKGGYLQFTATVTGITDQTVTWSAEGGGAGLLTVAGNEASPTLTVKAMSTVDTSKSGTATVTVMPARTIFQPLTTLP